MMRLATFQEFFSLGGSHELRVITIPHFSSLLVLVAFLLRYCLKSLISGLSKPKSGAKQPVLNSVPSIVPILGHHLSLLSAPAEKLQQWAKQYGSVFMIRLGNRRVTMVNSGAAAREIYARHSNALNSRPEVWTYHHMFSKATKSTMSSTPFNQLFSNARKAAPFSAAYLQRNLVLVDLETKRFLEQCLETNGKAVDPIRMLQRMNTSLNLNMCWGKRIMSCDDPLFLEMTECEYKIVDLRNVYTNFQDGIPFLRNSLWSTKSKEAVCLRRRRDSYLGLLNQELDERIARGEETHCLRAELLSQGDAYEEEMTLLCITMLAAGIGPTAAALHWGRASGYELNDGAGCAYVSGMAQEILRFFTPTRLGLPRLTTKDIYYEDRLIPRNSIVVMNAWACNRDPEYWPDDPNIFKPERWLAQHAATDKSPPSPPHFAFSLGARSCAGTALANRLCHIFYTRLISAFEIRLAEGSTFGLDPLLDSTWEALLAQPKDLKIVFTPRNETVLQSTL